MREPAVADRGASVRVARAEGRDLDACLALRHRVFVVEQGVPLALERDEHDAHATHWIARVGDTVVGTARARVVGDAAKAERVAVAAAARGTGAGRALMGAIEDWAREGGLVSVALNAQAGAIAFYRALGYATEGEPFEEAGIPHRAMRKAL
jgi:predicted GNAT family N-acyltransferase